MKFCVAHSVQADTRHWRKALFFAPVAKRPEVWTCRRTKTLERVAGVLPTGQEASIGQELVRLGCLGKKFAPRASCHLWRVHAFIDGSASMVQSSVHLLYGQPEASRHKGEKASDYQFGAWKTDRDSGLPPGVKAGRLALVFSLV